MDLYPSALLDSVVVITCAILLWKHARVSALHPAPVYLLFHVLVVTERVYSVLAGSPTLFTGSGRGVLPVSEAEIAWAVNLADLALITMTAAWIKVGADDRRKYGIPAGNTLPDPNGAMLSEKVIWIVGGIAAPIGLVALYYFGNTLTVGTYGAYKVDLGEWNSSSWIMITQSWAGLVLLCLIYYYGFRKMFVVPMCAYLLLMAVQGYNRFRVLLPLIYLLLVWLSRRGRKWPPLWMGGAGLAVLLVFYPLKTIGTMVQTGKPVSDIAEVTANMLEDVTGGHSGDQVVLDEFASTVSLVDNSDRYYYGTLYYPLLTLPVP